MGCRRDCARGRPRRHAVRVRRRGLLCRIDHTARYQCGVPSRRRPDCRSQTCVALLGGSGGAAADDVDGLGGDVRPPGRGEARTRCGGGDPHHRWRGRGWVDRRPDRATAHGPHRHRHSLSTGNPRVGKGLGAHHVIDHSRPLAPQIAELGIGAPAFVFSTTHTEQHVADIAELIAPQGRFGLIDDPKAFDIMVFKRKAVSIHHELMFTRSIYGTPDMNEQGEILDAMAALVDDGKIRTTLTRRLSPINAANLKTVHALIESGAAKGKIVLEGF
nr:hypothetical protein GPGIFMOB_00367 [Acinetobacter gerneri]